MWPYHAWAWLFFCILTSHAKLTNPVLAKAPVPILIDLYMRRSCYTAMATATPAGGSQLAGDARAH